MDAGLIPLPESDQYQTLKTQEMNMSTWLKLIGCSKRPITGPPFYGSYKEDHIGFRKERKPGIRMGDHLFLYAPGGSRRIFALAEAVIAPEHNNNYFIKSILVGQHVENRQSVLWKGDLL